MDDKNEIRIPSTGSLAIVCALSAMGFGVLTIISFRDSPNFFSFVGLAFTLAAIAGVILFASLNRASTQAHIAVANRNEDILAEGMGRVSGQLTGLVVAATASRVVAVPASLFRRPRISVSIPYREVTNFKAGHYSLDVRGKNGSISLAKCAPNQVAMLMKTLRSHVPGQP